MSVFIKLPLFHSFSRFSDCKDFFLIIYGIGKKRLENLQKHYKKNGILPRVHGNKGRLAIRVCSLETLKPVVSFLDNYAEEHAVAFPGRVPGFKRTDVRLLPSSNTKASIHRVYEQAAASAGVTAVLYPKFVEMWNKLRTQMRITKPNPSCTVETVLLGTTSSVFGFNCSFQNNFVRVRFLNDIVCRSSAFVAVVFSR